MVITYKKAGTSEDLLVDCREDQVLLGHRECLTEGILCLSRSEFDSLSERQILKRFNAYIDSLLKYIETDRPIEIVDGQLQLKWDKTCRQWMPAGDVLRCVVNWNSNTGNTDRLDGLAIRIDDKSLTGQELLDMIETYEGWGMRIEFMHQNRLTDPPKPILKGRGRK